MSWMSDLCQTYDACFGKKLTFQPRAELMPVAHSTQNAQIEIVLNGDGMFRNAEIVPKDGAVTVIPVTEDSASRSSGIAPHPLCDKLEYIAADYAVYSKKDNAKKYKAYLEPVERLGRISLLLSESASDLYLSEKGKCDCRFVGSGDFAGR